MPITLPKPAALHIPTSPEPSSELSFAKDRSYPDRYDVSPTGLGVAAPSESDLQMIVKYLSEIYFRIGSAGSLDAEMINFIKASSGVMGEMLANIKSARAPRKEQSYLPSPGEMVSAIRSSLSLNISEMARVVRVERPTIYEWIGGRSNPHPDNRERLSKVFAMSQEWKKLSPLPVDSYVRQPDITGKSIVDLLSEEFIDTRKVLARLKELIAVQSKTKQDSLEKGTSLSVRELAKKHNLVIVERTDTIDSLTGKRIGPE
jgi:transcriptional regulator with XRE-family HTH domain